MAKFKFDSKEEKVRLQERAQSLKPKANNIVATELGWCQSRPNGTLEVLVSFAGLDTLLGDIDVEVTDEAPIEIRISLEDVVDEEETASEVEEAEPVVVAPKKGGRPKKVAD
jgi:hypothetical protein